MQYPILLAILTILALISAAAPKIKSLDSAAFINYKVGKIIVRKQQKVNCNNIA